MNMNFNIKNDREIWPKIYQIIRFMRALQAQIDAISKGGIKVILPFSYDKDTGDVVWNDYGKVYFNTDISIKHGDTDIPSLIEYLNDLKTQIEYIKNIIAGLDEMISGNEYIIKKLDMLCNEIDSVNNNLGGFTRYVSLNETHANDELVINRGLTISNKQCIGGNIIGYGGEVTVDFKTEDINGILCTGVSGADASKETAEVYYTTGTDIAFNPKCLYLLNLNEGIVGESSVEFKNVLSNIKLESADFTIDLNVIKGRVVIDSNGLIGELKLGVGTNLFRPMFTFIKESKLFTVDAENYVLNDIDTIINITSTDIKWNGNSVVSNVGGKVFLDISGNGFTILNPTNIDSETSVVKFINSSYLNIDNSRGEPTEEQINKFKEKYNINVFEYGGNFQNVSNGTPSISFKGTNENDIVTMTYQDITTSTSGEKKKGLYINSDIRIKYGEGEYEEITISEMFGILLNRIITLERINSFHDSTETTVVPDAYNNVSDKMVRELYENDVHRGVYKKYP